MTTPTNEEVRRQFEAWARTESIDLTRTSDGDYLWPSVDWSYAAYQAALSSPAVVALVEALRTVADWKLPETGETWPSGAPVSYEANHGSLGVRDYMRNVAHTALAPFTTGAGHVE